MKIRKAILILLALVLTFALCACGKKASSDTNKEETSKEIESIEIKEYKIAMVPKTTTLGWFKTVEAGVKKYNENNGTNYVYTGPTDVADQASFVEQMLSEDWDAICIVPHDAQSIAPVLEKAREKGIVVITYEAETMDPKYFDYDVEPYVAADTGKYYGETMAQANNGQGGYIQFVGSFNTVAHNMWCDAADEYLATNTNMVKIGRYETQEDIDKAYSLTKELLQANPEIVAIESSCSIDIAGAAKAVEELGLAGKVMLAGNSLPSAAREYVKSGTIKKFYTTNPADTAQAMLELAEAVLDQGASFDVNSYKGTIPGYTDLTVNGQVIYGKAGFDVTAENIDNFDF